MTLPHFSSTHTALVFHQYQPSHLVVALASQELYIYNVEAKRLTDWSHEHSNHLPDKFLRLKDRVMGVAFNPGRRNSLLVWGSAYLCQIDLDKDIITFDSTVHKRKRAWLRKSGHKKSEDALMRVPIDKTNFRIETKFHLLAFVDFAGSDSIAMVEVPLSKIIEKLPPSFYKAKYGT